VRLLGAEPSAGRRGPGARRIQEARRRSGRASRSDHALRVRPRRGAAVPLVDRPPALAGATECRARRCRRRRSALTSPRRCSVALAESALRAPVSAGTLCPPPQTQDHHLTGGQLFRVGGERDGRRSVANGHWRARRRGALGQCGDADGTGATDGGLKGQQPLALGCPIPSARRWQTSRRAQYGARLMTEAGACRARIGRRLSAPHARGRPCSSTSKSA
jgi:hypothetical protein